MRLLYFTDTHIRGTTPRSRTDDFYETMKRKMNEVLTLAKEKQVDYILHGGDLFDRPNLSPKIVREFASLLRQFQVPIYAIAGNHDIYGHNPDTVERTMLGLLDAFGVVHLIRSNQPVSLEKQGLVVQVTGQPFHYDLDKRDMVMDYQVSNQMDADYCIHMVHGMLVDRALPAGVAHTMINRLWEYDLGWDLLLTGHYHAGFPLQERENQWIVNPGALARIDAQRAEMKRIPQVAIIDLSDSIQVKLIPLQTAQSGKEIFDRSWIEETAFREQRWASFVQQVGAAGEYQGIQVEQIIEEIAKLEGIDQRVKLEALRRLAEVEEREGAMEH